MQAIKYVYMQNFMFVGVSVFEILGVQPEEDEDEEEHGKIVKYQIAHLFYKILLIYLLILI